MGINTASLQIQRSQFNGPEWGGEISVRDMGRIATALARLHGPALQQKAAGADKQCFAYGIGPNSTEPMIAVVSGAASASGCLDAVKTAIELSDKRLSNSIMISRN